jgi:hypothetical protein
MSDVRIKTMIIDNSTVSIIFNFNGDSIGKFDLPELH